MIDAIGAAGVTPPTASRYYSRRATPRIELLGLLHGHIVSLNLSLLVRDLSTGGFAVESPISFPRGVVHEFRLTTDGADPIHVRARAMYCRAADADSALPFVAGFSFLKGAESGPAIDRLIDTATAVLKFP